MSEKIALLNQLAIDRPGQTALHKKTPNWRIWGTLLAMVVSGAGWMIFDGLTEKHIRAATSQPATNYKSESGVEALLDASGYIVARRQATVAAKITDQVKQIFIEEGQHVTAGQIIAQLDDTNTIAALAVAQAQVQEVQAKLAAAWIAIEDAKPNYLRKRSLLPLGLTTGQSFDDSKTLYDSSRYNLIVLGKSLKVATANLRVAISNQQDTVVRAPFDGVITVKAAQPGEIVSPVSAGGGFTRTGIGTIVDMNSLEVETDVSENYIGRVQPGRSTSITLNAYPDWPIPGQVVAIIPTADRASATIRVRIEILLHSERILPQMGAHVKFLTDDKHSSR